MSLPNLDSLLEELGSIKAVAEAHGAALVAELGDEVSAVEAIDDPARIARFGLIYETKALQALRDGSDAGDCQKWADVAFRCWKALGTWDTGGKGEFSHAGLEVLRAELPPPPTHLNLALALRLGTCGLLAKNPAGSRHELTNVGIRNAQTGDWRSLVIQNVFQGVVLLIRRGGGWRDVDDAMARLRRLRELQAEFEDEYLTEEEEGAPRQAAAYQLVGLYHLAQIATLTGEFVSSGQPGSSEIRGRLARHFDRSAEALNAAQAQSMTHWASLIWAACSQLVRDSIWTHVEGLGDSVKEFAALLVDESRPSPVFELWPSQQEALRGNLLAPYPRAISVQMPTSAGKTLLAKFSVAQTLALNPSSTVVYLVPTRALVNQVTVDFRRDFGRMGKTVEQAVPALELDPTEEALLKGSVDILVSTPEKFDLLLRRGHPVAQDISLVIADEAHNLSDGVRGARLELLLGTLKRDRPDARFLMLSPFLPNDEELVRWLADDRYAPPIKVDWKPSWKVVGIVKTVGRAPHRDLIFKTLPASEGLRIPGGARVKLKEFPEARSTTPKKDLSAEAARYFKRDGTVLVLCYGPADAMDRAGQIAADQDVRDQPSRVESIKRYLKAELGSESRLVSLIERGVSYHHAGLSQEVRWLVEALIRSNDIDVVCGTTTLAQGVNFPIKTVLIEQLRKGRVPLTYEDFWNVAGRAGRALVDSLGVVAFPARGDKDEESYREFLSKEAEAITSQLAHLVERIDEISENFDMGAVARWPELGSLMQFLAHAFRVAGSQALADEVEDLLRSSLVYHQVRAAGGESAGAQLVSLCRSYLRQLRGREAAVSLADQTGFSTPSVLHLQLRLEHNPGLRDPESWTPEKLFGEDLRPLTERVSAIAEIPEIRLGTDQPARFSARRIAAILTDWVSGVGIDVMANRYPVSDATEPEKQLSNFSRYLFRLLGKASWGLGALETLSLAGQGDSVPKEAAHVPSMVYFGVNQPEAVWLRMVGVPRLVASRLGDEWKSTGRSSPDSFEGLREWVSSLDDEDWSGALPATSDLTPNDMRVVWSELSGSGELADSP